MLIVKISYKNVTVHIRITEITPLCSINFIMLQQQFHESKLQPTKNLRSLNRFELHPMLSET